MNDATLGPFKGAISEEDGSKASLFGRRRKATRASFITPPPQPPSRRSGGSGGGARGGGDGGDDDGVNVFNTFTLSFLGKTRGDDVAVGEVDDSDE